MKATTTTTINGLEITVNIYNHISFKNNKNNFWVTDEEVEKEVGGKILPSFRYIFLKSLL